MPSRRMVLRMFAHGSAVVNARRATQPRGQAGATTVGSAGLDNDPAVAESHFTFLSYLNGA